MIRDVQPTLDIHKSGQSQVSVGTRLEKWELGWRLGLLTVCEFDVAEG